MRSRALAVITLWIGAAPLLAQHAAEEGGSSPFAGDLGNALWTAIIFVVVVLVLGKFAWKPVVATLQAREDFIRKALADAKGDREEAAARLQEYRDQLHAAHTEVAKILDEGRRDAEEVKRRIVEEAQAEGKRVTERAKREIAIASETAVKDLYTRAAELATAAASRILERELKPADHERLIAEAIRELDSAQHH